jgi:hypothetical protein
LNEGCVEHDAADHLILKPIVFEDNLCVTAHRKRESLLLGHHHMNGAVFLSVLLGGRKTENSIDVKPFTVVDIKARNAAASSHFRNFVELNRSQSLNSG